jgi:hypothetical protein
VCAGEGCSIANREGFGRFLHTLPSVALLMLFSVVQDVEYLRHVVTVPGVEI